jgi:hypothetical protein
MEISSKKNSMQKPCSERYAQTYKEELKNSPSGNYEFELKQWIQQVINIAEKNGDICKRNQFLALRAEIF